MDVVEFAMLVAEVAVEVVTEDWREILAGASGYLLADAGKGVWRLIRGY